MAKRGFVSALASSTHRIAKPNMWMKKKRPQNQFLLETLFISLPPLFKEAVSLMGTITMFVTKTLLTSWCQSSSHPLGIVQSLYRSGDVSSSAR
jgi:hypothetical protein